MFSTWPAQFVFFLSEKWLASYFVFCRITNVGLLAFLRPAGPEIFQDEEGCILLRKWATSNKKWAISNNKWVVKWKKYSKHAISSEILFSFGFWYFKFHCFCAGKISLDLNWGMFSFKINLNLARNFGLYAVWDRFGGWLVGLLSSCIHKVSQKET